MKLEITPEPSPDERAAIHAALAELLAEQPRDVNAWWRAGLVDELDDETEP